MSGTVWLQSLFKLYCRQLPGRTISVMDPMLCRAEDSHFALHTIFLVRHSTFTIRFNQTILALTALPLVLTDRCPSALLALIASPPMLASATASALLARTVLPPVLTLHAVAQHSSKAIGCSPCFNAGTMQVAIQIATRSYLSHTFT